VFPSLVSDVTESNGACPQLSARRLERYFLDRPLLAGDVDGRSASNCSDFDHIHCSVTRPWAILKPMCTFLSPTLSSTMITPSRS
jgi:hypothetical protein